MIGDVFIYNGTITIKYSVVVPATKDYEKMNKAAKKVFGEVFPKKGIGEVNGHKYKIIKSKNKILSRLTPQGVKIYRDIEEALKKS